MTRKLIVASLLCTFPVWCRIECYDKRWWKFAPVAGIVGAGYAVGLPILFLYLVRRFKNQILAGDKVVEHALGPVAVPRNT